MPAKAPTGYLPFDPLAAWCERRGETSLRGMARLLDVAASTVRWWIENGLTDSTADDVATHIVGEHPSALWNSDWDDLAGLTLDLDDDYSDLATCSIREILATSA